MYADFFAGWVAGGTSLIIGHPMDTIKARLQTMHVYRGIADCALRTVREESIKGLYKGLWAPVLSSGALTSLLFAGYGFGLKLLHPGESNITARKDLPMREILLASICGTMVQIIPAIPVELVKTRLQVQRETVGIARNLYNGPYDCIRQILRKDGVQGLFKGGSVLFMRDNIGYLFYIPVYEGGLRLLRRMNCNESFCQIMAGGSAGVIGWVSICPLEVIKNHVQTDKTGRQRSVLEVGKEIYSEGGSRAFFRGGLAMSIRGFAVNAVLFVVYENCLHHFERLF